ncbi:MAG TPA: ATP-binding protein [Terriglobia bacterium]|nr:ATP-binding protein [Terriglobia bacterium]
MKRPGLRLRITALYTVIFAASFGVFFLSAYHLVDTQLNQDATNELTDRVEGLRGYLQFENDVPVLHYNAEIPEISLFVRNATRFYQIYDLSHGGLVTQSPDMRLLGLSFVPQELELSRNGILDVNTDDGPLRFLNTRMKSPLGTEFLLQVGVSLKPMRDALHRFARLGLWLGPLALVLAATSGWFLASSALTPVRAIVRAVRKLELSTLHQRLPISGTDDELDQLAVTFNDAFSRLDAAVGEMKQLMGSMAHELRTPLAALRGEAEIALLHGTSIEELKRVLASQLEEIDRLSRLIGQILTVTKAESGLLSLERKPVDVEALLNDLADTLSVLASAREISLSLESVSPLVASGDEQWLKHALLNVLDNAIKYTPAGGSVAVRGYQTANQVVIEVRDTGIGIPADALPHIFERFYRAESSRAKDIEGVGLGLNLTKWIVDHHDGKIEVTSHPGAGTRVELRLPRAGVS